MMAIDQIVEFLIKPFIVLESMMLGTSIVGYYLLLTSPIKNGLYKALSVLFITSMIYSVTILISLFLLQMDYELLKQYLIFPLMIIMSFISRLLVLAGRLYLAHELRSTVIKQNGKAA